MWLQDAVGFGQLELAERLVRRNEKLARMKADCVYRTMALSEQLRLLHQRLLLDTSPLSVNGLRLVTRPPALCVCVFSHSIPRCSLEVAAWLCV